MKILIIEDNRNLAKSIIRMLSQERFSTDYFWNGEEGLGFLLQQHDKIDLVILDVMLPGRDGISICRTLREHNISTPILMLTARDTLEDKINGLNVGADDYLVKPFALEELLARVHALLRRPRVFASERIVINEHITFDASTRKAWNDGKEISLTPKEFAILELLLRYKNSTVSQQKIFDHCFDFSKDHQSNSIEVHIKNLRKKLFTNENEHLLKTVRGIGYCLEVQ